MGESTGTYHPPYTINISFQDTWRDKLVEIFSPYINLVQIVEVRASSFKSKNREDQDFYKTLSTGCQGRKELTPVLCKTRYFNSFTSKINK